MTATINSLDDGVILGNSSYACSPFLMTPYANPEIPQQEAYNSAHTKTRVVIEQTYGRWKRRFHVLHSEIRMAPEKVCLIIGACAVLHNIAVLLNEPLNDADLPDEVPEGEVYDGPQQGLTIRNHICNTFFGWTFVPISLTELEKNLNYTLSFSNSRLLLGGGRAVVWLVVSSLNSGR